MTTKQIKRLLFPLLLLLLVGCVDSANYAIFRESLDPIHDGIEAGMSTDEVDTVVADYPDVYVMDYAYDDEMGMEFELEEDNVQGGIIHQITMDGDPADAGVTSICFIKVLFVDDGEGGKHVLAKTDVSCPA